MSAAIIPGPWPGAGEPPAKPRKALAPALSGRGKYVEAIREIANEWAARRVPARPRPHLFVVSLAELPESDPAA